MPSSVEIVQSARAASGVVLPEVTSKRSVMDDQMVILMRQLEAHLGQLEIFLAPTTRMPPKLAAIPMIGSWFAPWCLRLYNRLFRRQQVTNRHLVDVLRMQAQVIERLVRHDGGEQ